MAHVIVRKYKKGEAGEKNQDAKFRKDERE